MAQRMHTTNAETQVVDKLTLAGSSPLEALALPNRSGTLRDIASASSKRTLQFECAHTRLKITRGGAANRFAGSERRAHAPHVLQLATQQGPRRMHVACLPFEDFPMSPPPLFAATKEYSFPGYQGKG